MTGREMLNALNAKLASLEQKNADLTAELEQVKTDGAAVSVKVDQLVVKAKP